MAKEKLTPETTDEIQETDAVETQIRSYRYERYRHP